MTKTLVCQACSKFLEAEEISVRDSGFMPTRRPTKCDECGKKFDVLAVHSEEPHKRAKLKALHRAEKVFAVGNEVPVLVEGGCGTPRKVKVQQVTWNHTMEFCVELEGESGRFTVNNNSLIIKANYPPRVYSVVQTQTTRYRIHKGTGKMQDVCPGCCPPMSRQGNPHVTRAAFTAGGDAGGACFWECNNCGHRLLRRPRRTKGRIALERRRARVKAAQ